MMLGILFGLFFLLLFIGMPVAYGMVISAVVTLFFDPSLTGIIIPQKLFTGMDSFSLMAVPFFMLAGTLMEKSGITDILVNWAKSLVGHFKGGLGHATIVTGVVMAGVSGSANADTSALASILVPIMRKDGYDDGYSCALVSSCGALGPVIPPSIMMVLYSGVTSIAIGKLFMAGIMPGILLAVSFCVMHGIRYGHVEKRASVKLTFKEFVSTFFQAIFALGMPILILGGIYGGIFTPTEAAAVSCIYAIIVGCVIYRNLSFKQIWKSVCEISVRVSSMLTIVCCATAMAWFVSSSGLAAAVSKAVLAGLSNKFAILTVVNLLLFVLGCIIDPTSIILLTCPIIIPITQALGLSSVHVGAFMIMNIAVGMVTPPFAGTLYISNQLADERNMGAVVRKLIPYIVMMFMITLVVAYIPQLSIALPKVLGMTV